MSLSCKLVLEPRMRKWSIKTFVLKKVDKSLTFISGNIGKCLHKLHSPRQNCYAHLSIAETLRGIFFFMGGNSGKSSREA